MARNKYDNWERLVRAVLRREWERQIALTHSLSSLGLSFRSTDEDNVVDRAPKSSDLRLDHSDCTRPIAAIMWTMMLPPNEQEQVWKLASLIFYVDHVSGKTCFLIGFLHLEIPEKSFLRKYSHPESRLLEVVEVKYSRYLHIEARIKKPMLSQGTLYAAYLVVGFPERHDCLMTRFEPENVVSIWWTEIKLRSFYVDLEGEEEIEVVVFEGSDEFWEGQWLEIDPYWRSRLVVEGIEIRLIITRDTDTDVPTTQRIHIKPLKLQLDWQSEPNFCWQCDLDSIPIMYPKSR